MFKSLKTACPFGEPLTHCKVCEHCVKPNARDRRVGNTYVHEWHHPRKEANPGQHERKKPNRIRKACGLL